jgi:hypothetical protein
MSANLAHASLLHLTVPSVIPRQHNLFLILEAFV